MNTRRVSIKYHKHLPLVLLAIGLIAFNPLSVEAQSKPIDVYVGGGISVPTGDLGEAWKLGFNGMGRVGLPIAPKIDVLLGIDFHSFALDVPSGVSGVDGGDITTIQFAGDLKFNLGLPMAPTNPYLLGGLGIGVAKISKLTLTGFGTLPSASESKFFVEVGGGVELSQIFIQAKFVSIFTEGGSISYFPLTLGVLF